MFPLNPEVSTVPDPKGVAAVTTGGPEGGVVGAAVGVGAVAVFVGAGLGPRGPVVRLPSGPRGAGRGKVETGVAAGAAACAELGGGGCCCGLLGRLPACIEKEQAMRVVEPTKAMGRMTLRM